MRILRWLGIGALAVAAMGVVVYATRSNPLGPISGRQLTGEVVTAPIADWTFTDAYMTIAVETRSAAPHSVTTVCFTHEGELYVPAQGGSQKSWTRFAVSDPRVRLKVGDKVYPARATRVTDASLAPALTAAAQEKYGNARQDASVFEYLWIVLVPTFTTLVREKYQIARGEDARVIANVWVFRMESRPVDAASAAISAGSGDRRFSRQRMPGPRR
jgi:hypothetical protein